MTNSSWTTESVKTFTICNTRIRNDPNPMCHPSSFGKPVMHGVHWNDWILSYDAVTSLNIQDRISPRFTNLHFWKERSKTKFCFCFFCTFAHLHTQFHWNFMFYQVYEALALSQSWAIPQSFYLSTHWQQEGWLTCGTDGRLTSAQLREVSASKNARTLDFFFLIKKILNYTAGPCVWKGSNNFGK